MAKKYWSFSFSISPSDDYSGLISFKIDCCWSSPAPQSESIHSLALNLLHGPTLTSIHDYWKTIALIRWTFVGKVTSLLFNMLSRLVKAFLPRSKHLLISWLQSQSGLILKPKKMKSNTVFTFSRSIFYEVIAPDAMTFADKLKELRKQKGISQEQLAEKIYIKSINFFI